MTIGLENMTGDPEFSIFLGMRPNTAIGSIAIVFGGYENTDRLPHYGVS